MYLEKIQSKIDRVLGYPAKSVSARVKRALGFESVARELFMASSEAREDLNRKLDRILGPGASKLPPRVKRGLGFESLEQRLVMSATLGAGDDVFTWVDSDGDTQAIEVTSGSVEVHFTDDVGNTGEITQIRLLKNNAGFDVSTSDIDSIDSNGKHIGNLNIGVGVGGQSADTDGTVDSITADKHIQGSIFIGGNVGSITVGNNVQGEVTVEGDLDSLTAGGQIQGDLNVGEAEGDFSLADSDFNYESYFADSTAVNFDSASESIEALNEDAQAVREMSPSQFRDLTADQVQYLSVDQLASISNANHFYAMSSDARAALNAEQVQALDTSNISISYLTTSQRESLSPDQVQAVSSSRLRYLPASQIEHVTTDQLENISNANHFYAMSSDARGALNAEQVQSLDTSVISIGYLTASQREHLTPEQVQAVSVSRLRYLPASQIEHVTTEQFSSITNANHFYSIPSDARAALNAEQVQALDTSIISIGYLTPSQREALSPEQVQAVTVSRLRYLPASQMEHVTSEQLSSITNANHFYSISADARVVLDAEQVQALDTSIISIGYLSEAQRESLTPEQVQAVTASRLRYLPASQMEHVTSEQLSSITNANHFYSISANARATLNAAQVQALDTSIISIGYLTVSQREALTPEQVQVVPPSQLRYLPVSQIPHVTNAQLASITNANHFRNMSAEARAALSHEQIQALSTSLGGIGYAGTEGDDFLSGNSYSNHIDGLAGDDTLQGGGGDDVLEGGEGNDELDGGSGDDLLIGGAGDDQLISGGGSDVMEGGDGDDNFKFVGAQDGDVIQADGGEGIDSLDLSQFSRGDIHVTADQIVVTLSGGGSFSIEYAQIESIRLSDGAYELTSLIEPTAEDDEYAVDSNMVLTVEGEEGLLANDTGSVDDDQLTVVKVDTTGTLGHVVYDSETGGFVYDPQGQFIGLSSGETAVDQFTYTVQNQYGNTQTATVTVTVTGVEPGLASLASVDSSNLVGHWKLDGDAEDSSEFENDGSVLNGEGDEYVGGTVGSGSASFDGQNDMIQTDSGHSPQLTGDYTTSVWIRPDATQKNWAGIYTATNASGSTNHWNLQFDNSSQRNVVIYHGGQKWDTGIDLTDVDDGQWHNIVLVREGTTMSIYLDGVLKKIGTFNSDPLGSADHLNIGGDRTGSTNYLYTGEIDDLRVYNIALSGDELEALFELDNDAPQSSGIDDVIVSEDAGETVIDLHDTFSDDKDSDDALTYSVVSNTNSGLFDEVTIGADGKLTLRYSANAFGAAHVTIRATDTNGEFVETAFTVTVNAVNDVPVTSGLGDLVVNADDPDTVINLHDAFSDLEDVDNNLTYTVTGNTNSKLFDGVTIDADGTLRLNYAAEAAGHGQLTIRATDVGGAFVETTFQVTVNAAITAPQTRSFTDSGAQSITRNVSSNSGNGANSQNFETSPPFVPVSGDFLPIAQSKSENYSGAFHGLGEENQDFFNQTGNPYVGFGKQMNQTPESPSDDSPAEDSLAAQSSYGSGMERLRQLQKQQSHNISEETPDAITGQGKESEHTTDEKQTAPQKQAPPQTPPEFVIPDAPEADDSLPPFEDGADPELTKVDRALDIIFQGWDDEMPSRLGAAAYYELSQPDNADTDPLGEETLDLLATAVGATVLSTAGVAAPAERVGTQGVYDSHKLRKRRPDNDKR